MSHRPRSLSHRPRSLLYRPRSLLYRPRSLAEFIEAGRDHLGRDCERPRSLWSVNITHDALRQRNSELAYAASFIFATMFKPFQQFDCKKSGGISFGMKPMCDTCKTTETTMWRKSADGEVLCNSCGLNSGKVADDSNDNSSSNYGTGKGVNGVGSQFVGRVRKSARLKPSKYKLQNTTKTLATKGKNRRVIFKKNVRISDSILLVWTIAKAMVMDGGEIRRICRYFCSLGPHLEKKKHQNDRLKWPNCICTCHVIKKIIVNAWNRSICVSK